MPPLRDRVLTAFQHRFGHPASVLARAPGRVNLLGAHVDYSEGWVLPGAIDRAVWLAAAPGGGRVVALDLDEEMQLSPEPGSANGDWRDLVRGVQWALAERGLRPAGCDVVFASDVPQGAGVSSSAAVEMALLLAWESLSAWRLAGVERARIGQHAENGFLGVGSGIMDQYASLHGRRQSVLLLDCRRLEHEVLPLPPSLAVVLADSGVRRRLSGSGFNSRRTECGEAVARLAERLPQVRTLRDVSAAQLERHADLLSPTLLRRARHAVEECERVLAAAAAIREGRIEALGEQIRRSHESSRDLYETSIPELDVLAEAAWAVPGCYGARVMGGGFGGCVGALVERHAAAEVLAAMCGALAERYGSDHGGFVCRFDDGARVEPLG